MRDKTARILAVVIVASVLALIGTGVGMALILRASGASGNQPSPPNTQATPALGVTHVFIRNDAYQPANIQVVWGTAVTWTNQDTAVHSTEWVRIVLGVWLFFVPWILGFVVSSPVTWITWITGILTVALALWKLLEARRLHLRTRASSL